MRDEQTEAGRNSDPLDELLRMARWPGEEEDDLDELLKMAKWPEPTVQLPPDSVREGSSFAYATAFTILIAASIFAISVRHRHNSASVSPKAISLVPSPAAVEKFGPVDTGSKPMKRLLNEFKMPLPKPDVSMALSPGELQVKMLSRRGRSKTASPADRLIFAYLAHRIAHPTGSIEEPLEMLSGSPAEIERQLLEHFGGLSNAQECAAIELLGHIGSEASVPLLLRIRRRPMAREPAIRALLKLADLATLGRLMQTESDPLLRADLADVIRAKAEPRTLLFKRANEGEPLCYDSGFNRLRVTKSF